MNVNFVLSLNFLAYFVSFIRCYRKYGISIVSFVWLIYSVFAVFSVYLCASGLYWDVMYTSVPLYAPISLIPYIMNYICVFILLKPLEKIYKGNIKFYLFKYTKKNWTLVHWVLFFDVVYALIKIYQFKIAYSYGFGNFHSLGGNVQGELFYGGNVFLLLLNYIGRFSHLTLIPFILIFVINGYIKGFCTKKTMKLFVAFYIFNALSIGLTTGSRANLFFGILNIAFFLNLFWNDITLKIKRNFFLIFSVIISFVFWVTMQITNERFGQNVKRTAIESIYEYLGESFPVLGYEYWGNVRFTYGERLFNDFYKMLDSSIKSRDADSWASYIGARVDYFKTLYGDLYIEFGPFIPIIIIWLIAYSMRRYLTRKSIGGEKIGVIYWYYSLCTGGLFGFLGLLSIFDVFVLFCTFFIVKVIRIQFLHRKYNVPVKY